MRLDWIIGYAARTDFPFWNVHQQRREQFTAGCFASVLARDVLLSVNHDCSRGGVIDRRYVLASRIARTLVLGEDAYGLFFAALIPGAAAVTYDDGPPINILQAVASGACVGVSVFTRGGSRYAGKNVPADLFAWASTRVEEISLVLPPFTTAACEAAGSPGTWAALDSPAARQRVQACLNEAEATCQV